MCTVAIIDNRFVNSVTMPYVFINFLKFILEPPFVVFDELLFKDSSHINNMYIKGWNNPCNLSMLLSFVCYRRIIWNLHIYIITMKKETKRTRFRSSSNKLFTEVRTMTILIISFVFKMIISKVKVNANNNEEE